MVAVDKKIELELVSPERLLLSEPVDMAVIPGAEGDLGILAGHSLLVTTLRPGIIDVYQGEQIVSSLFVGGGFAEVTDTRCTVLADDAVPLDGIDAASVQAEIDRLRDDIETARNEDEKQLATSRFAIAEAKLAATMRHAG